MLTYTALHSPNTPAHREQTRCITYTLHHTGCSAVRDLETHPTPPHPSQETTQEIQLIMRGWVDGLTNQTHSAHNTTLVVPR